MPQTVRVQQTRANEQRAQARAASLVVSSSTHQTPVNRPFRDGYPRLGRKGAAMYRGWLVTVYIDTDTHYSYWKFCGVTRRTNSACSRELLELLS